MSPNHLPRHSHPPLILKWVDACSQCSGTVNELSACGTTWRALSKLEVRNGDLMGFKLTQMVI